MKKRSKNGIKQQRGNTILIALVSLTLLGSAVVGLFQAYFQLGRNRTITKTKISFIDYENAFVQALGPVLMNALSSCNLNALNNLNVSLGTSGSVSLLASSLKDQIGRGLGIANSTQDPIQTELNETFNTCPQQVTAVASSSPGVYFLCVGFKGIDGQPFQNLAGVFAKVRVELSSRNSSGDVRLLSQAQTCNDFTNSTTRELKLSYQIFYKGLTDPNRPLKKSGTRLFSQ
jgi:hypothetical protein